MARKPRVHFTGTLYHVIARGNNGQKIFRNEEDYRLYWSFLKEYKARFGFLPYAYVLMPTHIHLLVEVGETPLSRVMQNLQFRYTRKFNTRYKTWGHLFQGRYKALLCEKDSYFLELSAYIHLNPVRAGLVGEPSEYPWSSYPSYFKGEKDDLVDPDFLLAQFSNKKGVARREYARFVQDRIAQGHRADFYESKDQRFLGSEEFVEKMHQDLQENPSFLYEIPIPEIVHSASSVLRIPADLFYSSTRNREGAWGRAVVGYLGRRLSGYSVKTIAEHFHRDPVVISQGVKKVEEKIRSDQVIAKAMAVLQGSLGQAQKRRKKILK